MPVFLIRPHWEEAIEGRASVVQAQPDMLEIVPSGTCKGNGVRILLDHLGISPKDVMAIGDGENDVEMLELVSLGVALKNGAEKTKVVADVIGANNDEDGIAQAIYQDMTVKKVDDPNSGIPKYKFDFGSNNVVALRVGQQSELTDIAGVLRGLSGVITITTRDGFQTIKRDLELENVSGSVLAATLWSENANLVDEFSPYFETSTHHRRYDIYFGEVI